MEAFLNSWKVLLCPKRSRDSTGGAALCKVEQSVRGVFICHLWLSVYVTFSHWTFITAVRPIAWKELFQSWTMKELVKIYFSFKMITMGCRNKSQAFTAVTFVFFRVRREHRRWEERRFQRGWAQEDHGPCGQLLIPVCLHGHVHQ